MAIKYSGKEDPVLRSGRHYVRDGVEYRLTVYGGLHYIAGNSRPYFTITADQRRKNSRGRWEEDSCGCLHEVVLETFPEFADLVALHCSHDNGQPLHAVSNGWYWLTGILGGLGEQYHGGNPSPYRSESPEQIVERCREVFARHVRLPREQADALVERVRLVAAEKGPGEAKAVFSEWVASQAERWQREADECIAHHNLVVFGDRPPGE